MQLMQRRDQPNQTASRERNNERSVSGMASKIPASDMSAHAIAIVGMAGRFPDAPDLESFWRNILNGHESLRTFDVETLTNAGVAPAVQDHPDFVPKGTPLDHVEMFDAEFFGISAGEARTIDPQQRIFLECAWQAMEHAGYAPGQVNDPVGVFAGTGMNTYLMAHILSDRALVEAAGGYQLMLGNDKDFLCTRASYKLDLRGPSVTVQTACSTSLVAVEMACRALSHGECDMALAGGVSIGFPDKTGYIYQEGMILSPDGHCRPFDADAKGTRAGAGAGVVTLKRLADAQRDGDTIHAVIRGIAVNNDGAAKAGYTAPSINGQAEVVAMAQALAGVSARSIGYMETHGTATPLGDPIEIAALTQVFREETDDVGFCRLGALKANIGHLDAAAGVAGLIKAALVLREGIIPPLVNFNSPNPKLELETSPFAASAQATQWPITDTPRRAAVSSFGIGGTNAHAVLEQAPVDVPVAARTKHQLLVLSARTRTALTEASNELAAHLASTPSAPLDGVAWTLQSGRTNFSFRRFVVSADLEEAAAALSKSFLPRQHEGGSRRVAFLFSGQGSQHAGMGQDLYDNEPVYRAAIDRCGGILKSAEDLDLCKILFGGSDADLAETRIAQPVLFATEYAMAQLWKSWGVEPVAMLGHSIGEYVAAHIAGVMTLEEALCLVAERGRLMQLMPTGAMASVELSAGRLRARLPEGIEVAAENGPDLTAVSGGSAAVEAFLSTLESEGIEARRLHTSHAFHSAMMEPALAPFRECASKIALKAPQIPYVSNVTGTWITTEQATSPDYYARHLRQAVLFEPGLKLLARDAGLFLLEVGPGVTLSTLAGISLEGERHRIASSLPHPRDDQNDLRAVLSAAGVMWAAGVPLDWAALHGGNTPPRRRPLPTYPFERKRYWVDAKLGGLLQAAAEPVLETSAPAKELGQYLHVTSWASVPIDTQKTPEFSGAWLVIADNAEFGGKLVGGLEKGGANALLSVLQDDPIGASIGSDLSTLLERSSGPLRGIILALGLEPGVNMPGRYRYDMLSAVARLPELAAGQPVRILVATRGAVPVLDDPVRDVEASLVFGPVSMLGVETENLMPQHVDFSADGDAMSDRNVGRLLAEAAQENFEPLVAWRKRRWLRRFEPIALLPNQDAAAILKDKGVYLITGGMGGIGRTLAHWLAVQVSARIVLISRSPLPPRSEWEDRVSNASNGDRVSRIIEGILAIEAAGGEVSVECADVADRDAVRHVVDRTRQKWGDIDGVIHAAGTPGSGKLFVLDDLDEVSRTLSPKVDGLKVLADVLGDTPLDFVAVMSSINGILAAPGNAAYSSANAYLDAFPASATRPANWKRVLVFNWDAWRDVGMAARIEVAEKRRVERERFLAKAIAPEVGVEIFSRLLGSDIDQVAVTPYNLPLVVAAQRTQTWKRASAGDAAGSLGSEAGTGASIPVSDTIAARFERDEERVIAAIWQELIGAEMEGAHENFFERGGHSLMATRVLSRLNAVTGVRLTLRDIFDAPTIGELADCVVEQQNATIEEGDNDREEFVI
jgi:phthiocerol/phenolphthiocerol synthesis type-I polyketide synthase E